MHLIAGNYGIIYVYVARGSHFSQQIDCEYYLEHFDDLHIYYTSWLHVCKSRKYMTCTHYALSRHCH